MLPGQSTGDCECSGLDHLVQSDDPAIMALMEMTETVAKRPVRRYLSGIETARMRK